MRGAILMVIAMAGFALEDSLIKIMASDLPSGQILMMIGAGGALVFTVWAMATGQRPFAWSMLRGASGVRAVCEGMAALGFVSALALVPISLVTTIIQASPLMVTMGAALFFKESMPSPGLIGLAVLAVGAGVPSLYCIIAAMRIGDISFVTPFRYSRIVFGLLAGVIIFDETLDGYTLLGAAIIVTSGVYTLWREARLRKATRSVTP